MKKPVVRTLIVTVCLLYAGIAGASIIGSGHDFTLSGPGKFVGSSDEVCVYCHTPHGGINQDRDGNAGIPLWNRTLNEGVTNFTMYSSPTFTANPAAPDGKPTGYSLLCLSCHDGVSTLGGSGGNSIIDPGWGANPITFNYATIGDLSYPDGSNINLGRDLSNDHPISIIYDADLVSRDATLQNPTLIDSALKLYGSSRNLLECSTCHDPHEYGSTTGKAPFLRMSNAESAMCLSCHLK